MTRYYFDVRGDHLFLADQDGLDCDSIEDAGDQATRELIELASVMLLNGNNSRELIIEVRQGELTVLRAEVRLNLQRVQ